MELVERFSYFSFWLDESKFESLTYSEALAKWPGLVIPIEDILRSVNDNIDPRAAIKILDTLPWQFSWATNLGLEEPRYIPTNWFKLLNEFNGCSAGNTQEESLLQGLSELVERHVSAEIDAKRPTTPTIIDDNSDPTLTKLLADFKREGIELILKDFSLNMPLPTIGAVAYDLQTFPKASEIVFTAGTASTPAKAAIRAVTEVAQLAGDFCTNACYEASGLPKFRDLADIEWLKAGPTIKLQEVVSLGADDIKTELVSAIQKLAPLNVYTIQTTHPLLEIPTHYSIVPGLSFRERDKNQSLGLFTGRRLIEEADLETCISGLKLIHAFYGKAPFWSFFEGQVALRKKEYLKAHEAFKAAIPKQIDTDSKALAAFYAGYTLTLTNSYHEAIPSLREALAFDPYMQEAQNMLGVALFKEHNYAEAKEAFSQALAIDKGSAINLANLGMCEIHLDELALAYEHLTAALKLNPGITFAQNALETLAARTKAQAKTNDDSTPSDASPSNS